MGHIKEIGLYSKSSGEQLDWLCLLRGAHFSKAHRVIDSTPSSEIDPHHLVWTSAEGASLPLLSHGPFQESDSPIFSVGHTHSD